MIPDGILIGFRCHPREWQDEWKGRVAMPAFDPARQPLMDEAVEAAAALLWWAQYGASGETVSLASERARPAPAGERG